MRPATPRKLGLRHVWLELETRKFRCQDCDRCFWQRFPGILPRKRSTEPFRRCVSMKHWDGISRSRLGQREGIGSATVERWFQDFLKLHAAERRDAASVGLESPTLAGMVRNTLKGIRRSLGTAAAQKSPALTDDIRAMIGATDDSLIGTARSRSNFARPRGGVPTF